MPEPLDIAILNAGAKRPAIVYARYDMDAALAEWPFGNELKTLMNFRDRVHASLLQNNPRPQKTELTQFGHDLFNYMVRADVRRLYDRMRVPRAEG